MKNAFISFIIFGIMLIVMVFSLNYLDKVCTSVEKASDELETMINKEQWQEAYNASNKLLEEWKQYSSIIPMFVNHTEIDMLNNEMLRLTQYTKCEIKEEALASTHVIKFYISTILDLQKVNIQNIF